ncbi:MAG: HupE/UreJ family protein [Gammaproteobacteria bacterium]|nr:HupE/UreJ family protein [Gammaproteobacteria bacterium]
MPPLSRTRAPAGRVLLMALLVLTCAAAWAHKPSDSYLTLRVAGQQIAGQWDIALRDLEYALGLDTNQDHQITWGELRAQQEAIAAYALSHLHLTADAHACPVTTRAHLVDAHSDGAYEVLRFTARCPATIAQLGVDYRLFFDLDPQHQGLLHLESGAVTRTAILGIENPAQTFDVHRTEWFADFRQYLWLGIWHIWTGFDHLLFLLSLLLPAVLTRHHKAWQAAPDLRLSLWAVGKVVTAFTLAHSVTLSLAALGFVSIPSRLVESTIAASVVLAACNNLYPLFLARRWLLAFTFGLIHGFGFASVLADLGLTSGTLLTRLIAFNVGVEGGQLALVCLFIPVVWRLRGGFFYQRLVMNGGSFAIAVLALGWFSERALLIKFL